jgi:hypothetical protein
MNGGHGERQEMVCVFPFDPGAERRAGVGQLVSGGGAAREGRKDFESAL